ncbi:hypothetical protein B0H11DRAFT_1905236 [Mycena galericulata]|nr:hypothetical protein B0H11DRAFT_1905236 [Mycena galericulata]
MRDAILNFRAKSNPRLVQHAPISAPCARGSARYLSPTTRTSRTRLVGTNPFLALRRRLACSSDTFALGPRPPQVSRAALGMQVKSSKPSLLACLLALTKYEKGIVKQLIAYFEGVVDIHQARRRHPGTISGNQFLGEGGLQDIYDIRDKVRVIADQHANLGRTIDCSIVQHLQKLRTEINAHIKNVQNDTGKLATNVAKERELSTRLIAELSAGISAFKNTPMAITSKIPTSPTPPSSANSQNKFTKRTSNNPLASCSGTARTSRRASSAWQTYDEWQARAASSIAQTHYDVAAQWPRSHRTASGSRSALRPSARSRDPAAEPEHDYRAAGAQESYMRAYRESFFVLTSARFLHEYASSDPMSSGRKEPLFSLFLPMYTLGPPCAASAKSRKFHIEGRKDGRSTRSCEDMMEWWNDVRMLCVRYLVATGYVSEEQDGGSEEGTSVEEEDTETGLEYADAEDGEGPGPSRYTGHHQQGMEIGANGFPSHGNGHARQPSGSVADPAAPPLASAPHLHILPVYVPCLHATKENVHPHTLLAFSHRCYRAASSSPPTSSPPPHEPRLKFEQGAELYLQSIRTSARVRTNRRVLMISGYSRIQLSLCTYSFSSRIIRKRPTAPAPRAPGENTSRACLSVTYAHTTPSARAGGDARSASDDGGGWGRMLTSVLCQHGVLRRRRLHSAQRPTRLHNPMRRTAAAHLHLRETAETLPARYSC